MPYAPENPPPLGVGSVNDVKFTYAPGVRGAHGKINELKFIILKNERPPEVVPPLPIGIELSELADTKKSHREPAVLDNLRQQFRFVKEHLSDDTLMALYRKAKGNIALIQRAYYYVRKQTNAHDHLGLWHYIIEHPDKIDDQITIDTHEQKNRFINFNQRHYDYDQLERLELEQFKEAIRE